MNSHRSCRSPEEPLSLEALRLRHHERPLSLIQYPGLDNNMHQGWHCDTDTTRNPSVSNSPLVHVTCRVALRPRHHETPLSPSGTTMCKHLSRKREGEPRQEGPS